MAKISKHGEHTSTFVKKDKKKRKPITPSLRQTNRGIREKAIERYKNTFIFQLDGKERIWTKEEIEWQRENLKPDNSKESSKESSTKNKIKSNLFCDHKKGVIKDGYLVCSKCNGKWKMKHKIGTYK